MGLEASPSSGAVARADADAAIAEAIHLSGIGQAIAQLGDPSVYLAAMPTKQLTPQQAAEVRALVMQSMRSERFQQAVTASLKNSIRPMPTLSFSKSWVSLGSPDDRN